jgi:hypothetical protein
MKPVPRKHGPEQVVAADSVEEAGAVDADGAPEGAGSVVATRESKEAQDLRLFSILGL